MTARIDLARLRACSPFSCVSPPQSWPRVSVAGSGWLVLALALAACGGSSPPQVPAPVPPSGPGGSSAAPIVERQQPPARAPAATTLRQPAGAAEPAEPAEPESLTTETPNSDPPAQVSQLLQQISQTIEVLDSSGRRVRRAEFLALIESNPREVLRPLRIVPEKSAGRVLGLRLFGIREDNLGGLLGFHNGDRVEQINGTPAVDQGSMLVYEQMLRQAPALTVQMTRRGEPLTLYFELQ